MALTPLRWIAAALAGCLLAAAYFFTPVERQRRPEEQRDILVQRERQLGGSVSLAADRFRVLVIVDSLQRSLPRIPAGDTVRVLVDRGFPEAARPAFRDVTTRALAAVGNPRIPVDLAFVLDSTETVRGVARGTGRNVGVEFVLPANDADRCLSLVRIRANLPAAEAKRELSAIASRLADRRMLGPCAFFGSFGRPGPHVAEWLSRNSWSYTLVAGWSSRSTKWQPPPWYGFSEGTSDGWPLRFYMHADGYRCATGDERACESAVLAPETAFRRNALPRTWGTRIVSTTQNENEWYYRLHLGPRQASFLADLVNEVGVDRFRRFWTSSQPVPQAFEAATGRSLAAVTREWMDSQYGDYARRGAAVPPLSAGLALLFIGGGAATAIVAARRRTVR